MVRKRKFGMNFHSKCNLCDVLFKSNVEKVAHNNSGMHRIMMDTRKTQQSYVGNAKTLNDQITEAGKKESLIGLEYIYEYAEDSRGVRMYECKLCASAFKSDTIFFHVVGIQHRIEYLVKHHPIMGIDSNFEVQTQVHYRKLANNALAIEQTHGRKRINVVNEVYVSKANVREVIDSDADPKDESKKANKKMESFKQSNSDQAQLRRIEESKSQSHDDNDAARSMHRDRGWESLRDSVDVPRFPGYDHNQDFDARTLPRSSIPGLQNDSKDIAKVQQDTKAFDSSVQSGSGSFPPFRPAAASVPSVVPGFPLTGGGGPAAENVRQDIDFRQRNIDRGGPSVLHDREGNRKRSLASAVDTKSQNRMRNRSPDPRSKMQRPQSRFHGGGGRDIDVRSVLPLGGISFRELRTAHVEGRRGGFSSDNLPLFDKKKENDRDSDMDVCSMEFSDTEADDFWCNEELFEYLKSYYIGDDDGVQSVLEAVKLMSEALVRHKSRKEDLQKRILEEKERLENEKKDFLQMKKQKEYAISSRRTKKHENVEPFEEVTGTKKPQSSGAVPIQQSKDKVQQPPQVTVSKPSTAPVVQRAAQKPQETSKVQKPPQLDVSKKILMASVGPLLQQLFLKPETPVNFPQPQQLPGSQTPLVPATAPLAPQLGQRPQDSQKKPSLSDTKGPVSGAGVGPGSKMLFNQNPQNRASRFDNPNSFKEPSPMIGQGAGGYQGSNSRFNQNAQSSSSWSDNSGSLDKSKPPLGSNSRFNQEAQSSSFWSDKSGSLGNTKPPLGAGSNSRFRQDAQSSSFWSSNSESLDKSKPPLGAGLDSRFNQNVQSSSFWSSNSGSLDKSKPTLGAGFNSRFSQNVQSSGSWSDNSGSLDISKPPLGAGSDSRFNQNAQSSSFWSSNSGSLDKSKSPLGAGSNSRFNQNAQSSGSWSDNSGFLDKSKPPLDVGAKYKETQWNSGPQSGNQGFYNAPQPSTGMAAGTYGEQYTQNQWQSQYNSKGAYGSGVERPLGSQGPQPSASTGFSSDRQQGTWPSQNTTKPDFIPKSILKNRTGN